MLCRDRCVVTTFAFFQTKYRVNDIFHGNSMRSARAVCMVGYLLCIQLIKFIFDFIDSLLAIWSRDFNEMGFERFGDVFFSGYSIDYNMQIRLILIIKLLPRSPKIRRVFGREVAVQSIPARLYWMFFGRL